MAKIKAKPHAGPRLRYSISRVQQGSQHFYTLTMPMDVLARTCSVSLRSEDAESGFQRTLDHKRAQEIADYIDAGQGSIPNAIVLSAQDAAGVKILGGSKTLEFTDIPGAFLILDGQHRVYGFKLSKKSKNLRVPVVLYSGLTRQEESRLFIDINTKQRPVPAQLLLDIKRLAETEDETERTLRDIFDRFDKQQGSALAGLMSPYESQHNKISRVTFNAATKPLLEIIEGDAGRIYEIMNNYFSAINANFMHRTSEAILAKPVVFRAFVSLLPSAAQRVQDRYAGQYTAANFSEIIRPMLANLPMSRVLKPGTSWVQLRDYLEKRLKSKMSL